MQDLAIYTPFFYCRSSQIPAKKSSEKNIQKLETPAKKSLEKKNKKGETKLHAACVKVMV